MRFFGSAHSSLQPPKYIGKTTKNTICHNKCAVLTMTGKLTAHTHTHTHTHTRKYIPGWPHQIPHLVYTSNNVNMWSTYLPRPFVSSRKASTMLKNLKTRTDTITSEAWWSENDRNDLPKSCDKNWLFTQRLCYFISHITGSEQRTATLISLVPNFESILLAVLRLNLLSVIRLISYVFNLYILQSQIADSLLHSLMCIFYSYIIHNISA
jgi:hypothetical protein